MAKRFLDTGFYRSPFVRGLKGTMKSLYCYIICDCDGAGIWVKDLQIASTYIGFPVSEKDFEVFTKSGKARDLKNGKYFFPDFIEHQYPTGLQEKNPAHKNFVAALQKHNLMDGALKPLWSPFDGTLVMVMEEVMVIKEECEEKKEYPVELVEGFEKFNKWITDNTPNVFKLKDKFTIEEYERIKQEFKIADIQAVLTSMHNYAQLTKKYVSANLTFRTFIKNHLNSPIAKKNNAEELQFTRIKK